MAHTPPDKVSSTDGLPETSGPRRFDLTTEQQDTANLLERLLGRTISDRYVDFCRLSAGAFELRVSSPLAGHALRELDSILRQTLGVPFEALVSASEGDSARDATALDVLRDLGYSEDTIERAEKALQPQISHKDQIRKIVSRLGLAEDGDIARAWIGISAAHKKAHERPFNRELAVDDAFRAEWSAPFDMVVRGVAVQLQGKYTALTTRVDELAAMTDKARALSLFEKEIPGALPLQWHFFRSISGPGWLPELIKRKLIVEPMPYVADASRDNRLREWPVGQYLLQMAKSGDASTRALVLFALKPLAGSKHPDVRRDGLEILAALPAPDLARAADLAVSWLGEDEHFLGIHFGEQILARLAEAKEINACKIVAKSLFRVFDRGGNVGSLYSTHMYEHGLFKITPALTSALGLDALKMFCDLLEEAAVLEGKIKTDPPADYTSFSSLPLPRTEMDSHDIFGAVTCAVVRSATQLVEAGDSDARQVVTTLLARPYRVFKRIALNAAAIKPAGLPDEATALLFDFTLLESGNINQEYADLARVWFPQLSAEKQKELLVAIDAIPGKYIEGWQKRFADYYKRDVTKEDEEEFVNATVRDATWHWREALPEDRRKALEAFVAKKGDPDAWRAAFVGTSEQSPMESADFALSDAKTIANYLKSWTPVGEGSKQTKTALAYAFRNAVQADPGKFSAGAMEFAELPPLYVRRLLEGLHNSVQNKGAIDWAPVLDLVEATVRRVEKNNVGAESEGGDDPTWFWAAKQAIEMVRAGLQLGAAGIEFAFEARLRAIIDQLGAVVPDQPEFKDFEERFARNAYFGAEATLFGRWVELNVLFVFWLSKQEGSTIFARQREAFELIPQFKAFADRALALAGANARITRAIFGRYLSWLIYFGEAWVRANFDKIFPTNPEDRNAAWFAHLVNDNRPARNFVAEMRPMYEAEFSRFTETPASGERDHRQERCGEYVIVLYLWGVLPVDLLDLFLQSAPPELRRHIMWFVGRDLKSGDMLPEIRARALSYWEMRLAAGIASPQKDRFRTELGAIGNWDSFASADTKWLLDQQIKMFRAGFAPNHAYGVVEWAGKASDEYPNETIEMLEALFRNPLTDRWAYLTNQAALRKSFVAGLAATYPETHQRVRETIGLLASLGETSFLDLVKKPD